MGNILLRQSLKIRDFAREEKKLILHKKRKAQVKINVGKYAEGCYR